MEVGQERDAGAGRCTYVGIDNGVSGSIGILYSDGRTTFVETPVTEQQDYTKAKKRIHRIDWAQLRNVLEGVRSVDISGEDVPPVGFRGEVIRVFVERPMVNPGRFVATASALRAWEATLIVLDILGMGHSVLDSKEWQKVMLPAGCVGPELKVASMDAGIRLFPQQAEAIRKHKDADGLLIAEYARRKGL